MSSIKHNPLVMEQSFIALSSSNFILNLMPSARLFVQIIRNFQTSSFNAWKTYSPPNVYALDVSAAFF